MAKPIFRWMARLAALVTLLSASLVAQGPAHKTPTPPKYCSPCLFYGGDFDVNNSDENAVFNEVNSSADGEVYVPFHVPKQQKWRVTGLFVNLLSETNIAPSQVSWEIRKGVEAGSGGTLIASGVANSSYGGQFNCGGIAVFCFGLVMKGIKVSLPSGRYWLAVVPQCKGSSCDGGNDYFLVDVEDVPPHNYVGPLEPWDDSFWSSKSYSTFFDPTWGSSGACRGLGCDRFSAGVLGTK